MKILFVCLGNICRSPLAEGIFRDMASKKGLTVEVDSAGFESFHEGDGADPRSAGTAARHGIDIRDHVARLFTVEDFDRFDLIFVMDSVNYSDVMGKSRSAADRKKVDYILNLVTPGANQPVPDPYYGGKDGFEKVFVMLEEACAVLTGQLASSGTTEKQ